MRRRTNDANLTLALFSAALGPLILTLVLLVLV